jgi:peptidoglycan/xylan/chitin deacetylase (PgdA/CDA1 family)
MTRVPILMYHSISDQASARFQPFVVPPAHFAEQMDYLRQAGYVPLTVSQWVTGRAMWGAGQQQRPIVLTLDDGFADFDTQALPVLRRYGFGATLFVTTGFVGGTSRWLASEGEAARELLGWRQLAEIAREGIEIGAHTHSHPELDMLSLALARAEILESKRSLESHLGQTVLTFAYPYGYSTTGVRAAVREAGFQSACVVGYAMSSAREDVFALSRLLVPGGMGLQAFAKLVAGEGSALEAARRRGLSAAWKLVRYGRALLRQRRVHVVTEV